MGSRDSVNWAWQVGQSRWWADGQLAEGDPVLAFVLPDVYHGTDDVDGLRVETFHHFQFVIEKEVAIVATVLLQLLILESTDQMQLH